MLTNDIHTPPVSDLKISTFQEGASLAPLRQVHMPGLVQEENAETGEVQRWPA